MSYSDDTHPIPKSMRQKRILDAAAENPDASVRDIAAMVPTATTNLVEDVLETYGDPATEDEEYPESVANGEGPATTSPGWSTGQSNESLGQATDGGGSEYSTDKQTTEQSAQESKETSDGDDDPSPAALTAKQREVLRAIADRPAATQRELAAELGVSASTVSNHANSIEGFDWDERRSFVESLFDTDLSGHTGRTDDTPAGRDVQSKLEELAERFSELERQVESLEGEGHVAFDDPDLAHKVVHACMRAETISEEEELQILRSILGAE